MSLEAIESAIVERCRRGDEEAMSALVEVYQGRVRAYIGSYLHWRGIVDDLAQEVFLDAYRTLPTFRGDGPFSAWILGIARHRVLRHLRSSVRESRSFEALLGERVTNRVERDGDDLVTRAGALAALQRCMDGLPPKSARIVREHYFEGRSIVDVAKDLGQKDGAIRVALLRIRRGLRTCVQGRLSGENA